MGIPTATIGGAVGKGGRNSPNDVLAIQKLLNAKIMPPAKKLPETGRLDDELIDAIMQFQKSAAMMPTADGKIDAGGKTLAALKDPSKRFAYKPPVKVPGAMPGQKVKFEAEMVEAFKKQGAPESEIVQFLDFWQKKQFTDIKIVLGMISKADEARQFAIFCYKLKKWGVDFGKIARVLVVAGGIRAPQFIKIMDSVIRNAAKLERIAKAGEAAGIIITAIEVYIKISKDGDWSVLFAEVYKYGIGKGVPWAAAIEGFQSLLDGLLPDGAKATLMFRILRSFDPAGMGAVGVDAVVTLAMGAFDVITSRKTTADAFMPRLDRLVVRMKEGPAHVFADMGENAGSAMYDIAQMDSQDWHLMASYTWQQISGWAKSR